MPRPRLTGIILIILSSVLAVTQGYLIYDGALAHAGSTLPARLNTMELLVYSAIALPVTAVSLILLGTGLWIGWTILTLKVEKPMPEIVDKRDYARPKALLLCLVTLAFMALLILGIINRSYWAIAIPSGIISLVILGAIFWVGWAIVTTRTTLPPKK